MRLHTFEPEDRAYTTTPTKIGGHCLDHVVGLTLTWRRSLNKYSRRKSDSYYGTTEPEQASSSGSRESSSFVAAAGARGRVGAATAVCSTTLEPSMGRFGGLLGVVQRHHRPHQQQQYCNHQAEVKPTAFFTPPPPPSPVYRTVAELLLDTHAHACGASWHHSQEYGPEWPVEHRDDELEAATALTAVSAHIGSGSSIAAATAVARRHGKPGDSGDAMPYRSMATAATGHSATLMAILLSKLANDRSGGDSSSSDIAGVADTGASAAGDDGGVLGMIPLPAPATPKAGLSRTELLHRSVDSSIAQELDNSFRTTGTTVVVGGIGSGSGGGSWAWKARVDQTPRYSKLRRYDFVRELGNGSHGTILLVRKKRLGTTTAGNNMGNEGILGNVNKHGSSSRSNRSRSSSADHGNNGSSSGMGDLRVLKESQFLPEAVNEARLLLLAGGGGGAAGASAGVCEAKNSATGDDAWRVGIAGGATASLRGADGGRGYQRGGVVQVSTRTKYQSSTFAISCVWGEEGGSG